MRVQRTNDTIIEIWAFGNMQHAKESSIIFRLECLPLDIIKEIALKLPYEDIISLYAVSDKVVRLFQDWRFWRDKAAYRFSFPTDGFPQNAEAAIDRYQEVAKINAPMHILDLELFVTHHYQYTYDYTYRDTIMIKYLLYRGIIPHDRVPPILYHAVYYKDDELINVVSKYIIDNKIPIYYDEAVKAVGIIGYSDNYPELLKLIPDSMWYEILNGASKAGHLDLVLDLLNQGVVSCNYMTSAAARNHLPLVKHLIEHGIMQEDGIDIMLARAARLGHLHMVEYLVEKGAILTDDALDLLTSNSTTNNQKLLELVEVGKYLVRHGANPAVILVKRSTRIIELLKGFAEDFIAGKIQ